MLDLVKLLAVLAGILFLLYRRWNLGFVLLLASLAIGLLFGRSPLALLGDVADTLSAPLTLQLVAIVTLILSMGALLKKTAQLEGMVRALEALVTDNRINLAILPAIIGMLPMIGGAVFSAPMVDEVGNHLGIDKNRKTFVNYWFRHIWEWVLPTYPALILAAALLNVTPRSLTLAQWPFTLTAVIVGIAVGVAPIPRPLTARPDRLGVNGNLGLLGKSIWPIALVIVLSIPLNISLILSLIITIVLIVLINRLNLRQVWTTIVHGVPLKQVLLIVAVMLFRQLLNVTGAVDHIPDSLIGAGVPVPIVLFFIPLLAGLLTGLAPGAFGVSFPVILPLLAAGGMDQGAISLAFAGAFLGVLLSPMHLCFSLTRDYFDADWGSNYRMLVPCVLALVGVAILMYL